MIGSFRKFGVRWIVVHMEWNFVYDCVQKNIHTKRTYLSIPFLSHKLGLPLEWRDESWENYYEISNSGVYDAVLWKEKLHTKFHDVFEFSISKHLSLGRGGMILLDDEILKKIIQNGI